MIEVLKQALDALETEVSIDWTNNDEFNASAEKMHDAITSLRQAIKKLESQEPVAWIEKARLDWLTKYGDEADVYTLVTKYKFGYDVPLYITPPQRSESSGKPSAWVGLTDEEAQWLYDNGRTPGTLIDMVEAKLREKNSLHKEKNT